MKKTNNIILSITSLSHLAVHAQMMVFPTLLLVFNKEFSLGMDTLGLMATCSAFMFGLGAIPAGIFESRIGGKNLLIIYQLGSIVGGLTIIFSNNPIQITLGLGILGLFSSIYHPAGLTVLSKSLKNLSSGLAIHGIAGSIGLALGPLIAGITAEFRSWQLSYFFWVIIQFILFIATYFYIDDVDNHNIEKKDKIVLKNDKRSIILYYIMVITLGFSFGGFTTYMPTLFGMQTDGVFQIFPATIKAGLFTTLVFFSGIVGQTIGGYLGDRYNKVYLLNIIIIIIIPILVLIGYTKSWSLFFLSIALGIVYFSNQPVSNAILADLTSNAQRGLSYGISFFLSFGIGSFAAGFSGLIAENMGISTVFPAMAILLIPSVIFAFLMKRAAGTT